MSAPILVVEDNADNLKLISWTLEDRGYAFASVGNAEEAIAILDRGTFGLVLMDISLPGMDGKEATRRIRANPRTAALPVIAVTAHAVLGEADLGALDRSAHGSDAEVSRFVGCGRARRLGQAVALDHRYAERVEELDDVRRERSSSGDADPKAAAQPLAHLCEHEPVGQPLLPSEDAGHGLALSADTARASSPCRWPCS